ncbi:MAG TPA: DUF2934 domain-containing protein [Terriglobia bacterium]|nr:DUF2934 domain-containing protein [Terriglobia bacterium]
MGQSEANAQKSTSSSSKPRIVTCAGLADFEEHIRKAIAYRAYEIYESRGRGDGSDMGDWFSAEKELVKPANVQVTESGDQLRVQAKVAGFSAGQIQLGVSPNRLIIWGEGARLAGTGSAAHLLDEINLPAPVDPDEASAILNGETLDFQAPKEKSNAA